MADRSGGAAGGPARMDTGSDLDLDSHSDPEDTGDTDTGTVSSAGRASAEQQDGDVSAAAAAAAAGGAAEQAPGAFAHQSEGFSCDCCTTEGIDIMCLFADTPTLAHEPSASVEADAAGQRQEPLDNALLDRPRALASPLPEAKRDELHVPILRVRRRRGPRRLHGQA